MPCTEEMGRADRMKFMYGMHWILHSVELEGVQLFRTHINPQMDLQIRGYLNTHGSNRAWSICVYDGFFDPDSEWRVSHGLMSTWNVKYMCSFTALPQRYTLWGYVHGISPRTHAFQDERRPKIHCMNCFLFFFHLIFVARYFKQILTHRLFSLYLNFYKVAILFQL